MAVVVLGVPVVLDCAAVLAVVLSDAVPVVSVEVARSDGFAAPGDGELGCQVPVLLVALSVCA